jgi:hypothetical protein
VDQHKSQLDDRAVLRVLSAVTEDIRERLPAKDAKALSSAEDARAAIAALIATVGGRNIDASSITFEGSRAGPAARELLATLQQDPQIGPGLELELANPPSDAQKSPELALAGAVILGALISWLQTTMEIEINRGKDGKLYFSFRLKKEASNGNTMGGLVETVGRLIGL